MLKRQRQKRITRRYNNTRYKHKCTYARHQQYHFKTDAYIVQYRKYHRNKNWLLFFFQYQSAQAIYIAE